MAAVPIGNFVRYAIMASVAAYENWDTISGVFDRHQEVGSAPIFGYYVQNVIQFKDSTGAFSTREQGMFGIHYVNSTGGDLDTTWTTADFAAVESALATMWGSMKPMIPNDCKLLEHRWYAFGPGVHPPNPPVRITASAGGTGTYGTSSIAHQVASTVTLRTPLRRHWGRFYLPVGAAVNAAGGQIDSGNVDILANAARTMLTAPAASQGVLPVVYDRNRHAALGVTAIEVDSVPDIIRRRRPRNTAYKKILTS